jgi:iron complex outermembrane receptor protein
LSETGYVVKENVKDSYRRGVEIATVWQFLPFMRFEGNMTASVNKIKEYSQYVDVFDENWNIAGQDRLFFNERDIAFSPSLTGMGVVSFTPVDAAVFSVSGKYVGDQYMDNTSNEDFKIPAYSVFSLNLSYDFKIRERDASVDFYIDNIFDNMYYSNAWVYRAKFTDGSAYSEEGVYPQAGRNFMMKFSVRL